MTVWEVLHARHGATYATCATEEVAQKYLADLLKQQEKEGMRPTACIEEIDVIITYDEGDFK